MSKLKTYEIIYPPMHDGLGDIPKKDSQKFVRATRVNVHNGFAVLSNQNIACDEEKIVCVISESSGAIIKLVDE